MPPVRLRGDEKRQQPPPARLARDRPEGHRAWGRTGNGFPAEAQRRRGHTEVVTRCESGRMGWEEEEEKQGERCRQ